ncbi:serine hydrolase [Lewinella sp. W8]|uniref:serine hydrolase n=1 Tax=Lewinella sp. W8 TaxID=2528208 RepID=UPI001068497C|nr:serine hydrolase [Lewinella sp. W8]MTB51934.1 hypothetical protein [Lewinella sp. W8]
MKLSLPRPRFWLPLLLGLTLPGFAVAQNVLEQIIDANREDFGPWVKHPDSFEVQVLFTQIDRDEAGRIQLTSHRWGTTSNEYFYPASTVKMPVAALALQRINELGIVGLDARTPMLTGRGILPQAAPQTVAMTDTSSTSGLPTVENYLRKVFLVSDNDAYCRLFEWLGPNYINGALRAVGIHGARIQHRVGVGGFDTETHQYLNPIRFAEGFRTLYEVGERHHDYYDPLPALKGQFRGVGYVTNDGDIVEEPFDFSHKNYLSIQHLHDIVLRLVLPEAVPAEQRFKLSEEDYAMIRRAMSERPRESSSPRYDKADNYVKFWMYGDQPEETEIPTSLRIYNKVGWAYGYLTDAAYVMEETTGTEFLLVGVIHVNANRIYNDGNYEYESIGLPFFGQLGRAVMAFERDRRARGR